MTYFFATIKDIVLFKIYFKNLVFWTQNAVVLRLEIVSDDIKLSVRHFQWQNLSRFIALILLLLFQIMKICQCCGFMFTNFFFSLMATNALETNWVTFWNTRIFFVFLLFSDLFSHGSLMEINSTHKYFRSRIEFLLMIKNKKIKTHSKAIASQNILFINAIVIKVLFVLFLKTCTCNVSSGVVFHIQEWKSFWIIRGRHGIVALLYWIIFLLTFSLSL